MFRRNPLSRVPSRVARDGGVQETAARVPDEHEPSETSPDRQTNRWLALASIRSGAGIQVADVGRRRVVPLTAGPDAAYRRGTVLGLTMAEIFILLLFLILLAFLALAQSWDRKRESETTATQELRDELVALEKWRPVAEEFETPDEVVTLKRDKERAEQAAKRHRRQNEALRDVLAKEDGSAAEAVRVAQEAERRAEEAMEELRVVHAKGHNPPCWYQLVPRADGDGTREKPYYSFNLGVFDDAIVVRRAVKRRRVGRPTTTAAASPTKPSA